MRKRLIYLDSCYPEYFQGFSGETLIAFHHNGQTLNDVLNNLELNLNNESRDEWVYHEFHAAKERIKINNADKLNDKFIDDVDYENEESESLVHYFGFIDVND